MYCRGMKTLESTGGNELLARFNHGLAGLREVFHETGRLEDSNAKLDEISKLLCLEIVSVRDAEAGVPGLRDILERHREGAGMVLALNRALVLAAKSRTLRNYDGESLLGPNPKFNIAESEGRLAAKLASVVLESFNGFLRDAPSADSFEFLNEAFGHFIRDNFRQNIEDAQYMTPPEAVSFMTELGVRALEEQKIEKNAQPVVCDPSCGVGSFLAHFHRTWSRRRNQRGHPVLLGQDKVDRMARFTVLNLALFGITDARVFRGNSLLPGSPLDQYHGKCDLILTNPPFGARFSCTDLAMHSIRYFPSLHNHIQASGGTVDSELLFLDMYMVLLKPGGTVLAVLPDSVVSASGLPGMVRQSIQSQWSIRSITELPSVTFAQAGTRTKTCILEVTKAPRRCSVFMSSARQLGFEVASRKGVAYKREDGKNDLEPLLQVIYGARDTVYRDNGTPKVLSSMPSCVSLSQDALGVEGWTPSHYSADRLSALSKINSLAEGEEYEIRSLDSIVSLPAKNARRVLPSNGSKCISVLHLGDLGYLNVREMLAYSPKTPGQPCQAGDVLFSKINPRIPRAMVVPRVGFGLTCSSEFEVMRARPGYDPYEIMLLLLAEHAQKQVQSLTSGTSSSHNRIKTDELLRVTLAIPKKGTQRRRSYDQAVRAFRKAYESVNESNMAMLASWTKVNHLVGGSRPESDHALEHAPEVRTSGA